MGGPCPLGFRVADLEPGKKKPKTAWHTPEKTLEGMYLTILSRYPTEQEKETALEYYSGAESRFAAGTDIVWALLNTKEFIYRH